MRTAAGEEPPSLRASKKEIFGWVMFDFANSSFTTVIVTVVFSAYFVSHVVGDDVLGVKYWAISLCISNTIVILTGPVVGAVADFSASKKKFLFISYLICIIFTALLFFVKSGDILSGMVIFIIANVGFAAGENFCAAFLPEIAEPEEMGRISGYGWSVGYIGGLLSLLLCLLLFSLWGQAELQIRITFIITALFFLLSALPTFLFLKERRRSQASKATKGYILIAFRRMGDTFRAMRDFSELVKFLIIFFLYSCGIATVISFSAIYAESVIHFSKSETLLFFIVVQVSSSVGAFIFGFVEDRLGAKRTISITLVIWIVVVLGAYLSPSKGVFWAIGNLAGLAIGSSQSSSRALVALFTPESKSAEFFGLWGLSGKLAATVGIYSYSFITGATGSMKAAILTMAFFFLAGLVGMMFVNEEKGRHAVRTYTDILNPNNGTAG